MAQFDSGYATEPFRSLCAAAPGPEAYPAASFRIEWGPIFHRGRLDGSARVLVIGQDPAAQEAIVRRILVGEAGRRVQGFLAKLGITTSYVMVNTYLYSVYGSVDPFDETRLTDYRHQWLDAVMSPEVGGNVEAVVAFGSLADRAYKQWRQARPDEPAPGKYVHLLHPTAPRSAGTGGLTEAQLLANWNQGLQSLFPLQRPDVPIDQLTPYGSAFGDDDRPPIPSLDLPAGVPAWMLSADGWAVRQGDSLDSKRATIVVTVPDDARPW
jgi:uracil DNA glycosylase superfamily protein